MKQPLECSICGGPIEVKRTPDGRVYWDQGHNAEPINSGRCRDLCNADVILERMKTR